MAQLSARFHKFANVFRRAPSRLKGRLQPRLATLHYERVFAKRCTKPPAPFGLPTTRCRDTLQSFLPNVHSPRFLVISEAIRAAEPSTHSTAPFYRDACRSAEH